MILADILSKTSSPLFGKVIASLLGAYMVGSIPTAVWVGKIFHGIDVRDYGSGNAGATNTIRVLGLKTGIPVLLFDAFKGWIVVAIAMRLRFIDPATEQYLNFCLSMGIVSVLGHIFPIYAGLRGGKGVATIFGVIIALFPKAFLTVLLIFAILFAITRIVSVSSIVAAISFPLIAIFVFDTNAPSLIAFAIAIAVFIPITHKKNIVRLFRGEENRMSIGKKAKKQ